MAQLVLRYGDVVRVPVPGHPVFVVSRPEHAEHVFVTEHDNYPRSITYKPLKVFLGSALITAEGDDHRRQRRLLQPLFSWRQVSGLARQMSAGAARSCERLDRAAGTTISLLSAMSELTIDTLGSTLFGVDLGPDSAALAEVVDAQLHIAARCVRNPLTLFWPEAGLRTTPGYRRWASAAATLDGMVERMVAERRSGGARGEAGDLLDVLLAGDERGSFSDQEIRDQLMTFFMAGHETTANALSWAFALLSAHPWARERLEKEVDRVLDGGPPTRESYDDLVWTRAVVQEAIRLYPPVWTIERDARRDDVIDGVAVPAGSTVVVSPYLIHRNPAVWPNPEGFDPGRFMPGVGHDRHRLAFLAFGGGQRGCIGRSFALLEATIALASITQRYRFDLLPGADLRPEVGITLRPTRGLPVRVTRRSSSRTHPGVAGRSGPGRVPARSVGRTVVRLLHRPLDSMCDIFEERGDMVKLAIPRHPIFLMARPEHAEHVLVANQQNYRKAFTYRILEVFLGSGLITADGEAHARPRRLAQPTFTHRRVAALHDQMVTPADRTLDELDRRSDGSTVELASLLNAYTLDVLGSALFGTDLFSVSATAIPAVATLQDAVLTAARNPLSWIAPAAVRRTALRHSPWASAAATLDGVVERIVAERRSGGARGEAGDLLDVLLAGDERGSFSDQEIRDQLMTFFMAGHETTANALGWAFALLSAHPWARERLEEEVDRVLDGGAPTRERCEDLVWTRAVLQEALRLYPPVWTIERDARRDDVIDGVAVPAGSTVVVSPYLIHRNPAVWPNPEGFDPERFMPGAGGERHRLAFLAFGAGQRGCIARNFALLEATIALASITQRYRFDLLPGADLRPEVGVTLRPARGLPVTLTRRSGSREPAAIGPAVR